MDASTRLFRDMATPLSALHALERRFDAAFARCNPWHWLGALGFYLFWLISLSGLYVYAVFDASVGGAWRSLEQLSVEQWYLGGVMRSLHRYASDAFVLVMLLHLAKELASGHFRGFRWFSWLSGVPLIWLAYASGIGGYWLVWDQLAQFSIVATAEWFDWLPLGGDAIVRNFIVEVDDRFFSLLLFLHIGIPLLLLACMWLHIQRISHARALPPRPLALGTLATLLAVSLVRPAHSHPPADPASIPALLQLDWFYLVWHPLQYATSPGTLWALATLGTGLLALLPVIGRRPRPAVAVVSPDNCNGCGRCVADCPYEAVVLDPLPAARAGRRRARVLADRCASCGICAGACPSSTPFRSVERIVTGIDLPAQPVSALRDALEQVLRASPPPGAVIVFGCAQAATLSGLKSADTAPIVLACTGLLPPSLVEYALRGGARGVLITGCRPGRCEYRLGPDWTEQRLAGTREPHLRANVPQTRVRVAWFERGEESALQAELNAFRAALPATPETQRRARLGPRAERRRG